MRIFLLLTSLLFISTLHAEVTITSEPPTVVDEDSAYNYVLEAQSGSEGKISWGAVSPLPGWLEINRYVETYAGKSGIGFQGDGGVATEATLYSPHSVAVDSEGNIYIADLFNNRVRKVGTDGIMTTIAGNGEAGYDGDGGPATEAKLKYPAGVAVDGDGNVYIADWYNNRIRKVDTDGIITTVAGTGEYGFGGDGGPATEAKLKKPYSVDVDRYGNIYIADRNNKRIRKVDADGIITTVAGSGGTKYNGDGIPATEARISSP
jgi:sugar lactone lactonase YvrE